MSVAINTALQADCLHRSTPPSLHNLPRRQVECLDGTRLHTSHCIVAYLWGSKNLGTEMLAFARTLASHTCLHDSSADASKPFGCSASECTAARN